MGFNRQLDALMAVLAAIVVFVGCILDNRNTNQDQLTNIGLRILAGLVFGRREIVSSMF